MLRRGVHFFLRRKKRNSNENEMVLDPRDFLREQEEGFCGVYSRGLRLCFYLFAHFWGERENAQMCSFFSVVNFFCFS